MGEFDPLIGKLSDGELNSLAAENLGDLSLRDVVVLLKLVRAELELGQQLTLDEIPRQVRQELFGSRFASNLDGLLNSMRSYGPDTQNHAQVRTQCLESAQQLRDTVVGQLRPIVRMDEAKVRETMNEVEALRAELMESLDEVKKQQSVLASSSATQAESDLSHFYKAQAKSHSDTAKRFLWFAIGAGAVLTALTVWFFWIAPPAYSSSKTSEQWIDLVRHTLARLALLGIAGFVLAFCVRNYRVNKHLDVLNKRRENALNTFGLMQASVTTDDARNIVVGELVRAVFMHEDTGYLTTDTERTVVESPGGMLSAVTAMSRGKDA